MFYSNVHTHSTWCDGKNTLAEMAASGLAAGMTDLGFTSHSYAPFDPGCIGLTDQPGYQQAVRALAEEMAGKLAIKCGLEWDYFSPPPIAGYDYFIGSVHYFTPRNGVYRSVDESPESFQWTLNHWFGGDFLKMAEDYYQLVLQHMTQNQPLIVGHFDLITKFNDQLQYLTEDNQRQYDQLAREVLAEISQQLKTWDGMVEVNTGGMSRGWTQQPYPAEVLLQDLQQRKTPIIITSDSHETKTIDYRFSETKTMLQRLGFQETMQLKDGEFQKILLV